MGPFLRVVRRTIADRLVLIGDAAGYVDAITGEGLAIAFECAAALADILPYALAHARQRSGFASCTFVQMLPEIGYEVRLHDHWTLRVVDAAGALLIPETFGAGESSLCRCRDAARDAAPFEHPFRSLVVWSSGSTDW